MKYIGLKKRLLIGSFFVCSLITLCVSLFQIGRLQQREQELLQREIINFEQSVMSGLREAVWNYDWSMVNTVISSQINPQLSYIQICDSEYDQCVNAGKKGETPLREYSLNIYYKNSDIDHPITIGKAYLQLHYHRFSELFQQYILSEFIANGLGVFGVAIAILLLFYLGAIRRVVSVANYTRKIDLTAVESLPPLVRDEPGRIRDEVDLLAEAIDSLVARTKEEFSRRKQLERQLNHAQKMEALGTLAGGIAHDFNNILTAILGYVQLCYNAAESDSKTRRRLEHVLKAGDRATALIAQIMVFSRKSENHTQRLCLAAVITEALDLARAAWPETITVELNLDDSLSILGDANQLHQVLLNLATNAGHVLAENGGTIKISLDRRAISDPEKEGLDIDAGNYACLKFCDNGPGIPKEIQDRVFEPFFTTKETGKGTGMGLAVVHGIVRAHGGEILLEPGDGQGCCFTLYFPCAKTEPDKPEMLVCDICSALHGDEHILLVDDDPAVVGMGQDMLRTLGYQVTPCGQPKDALNLLSGDHTFDLVMTDLTMPEMTGIELATQLRQKQKDLPVVLYTGNADSFDPSVLDDGTIDLLLEKPFTMSDLSVAIRQALNRGKQ